jgi:hypothetical protein
MSCVTSSGDGRLADRIRAASGSRSHCGVVSSASKSSGPPPSMTTTRCSAGSEACRPRAIASWSKPRKVFGTTSTFDSPWASMNESSRSRKMCIIGLQTAPIREQAR